MNLTGEDPQADSEELEFLTRWRKVDPIHRSHLEALVNALGERLQTTARKIAETLIHTDELVERRTKPMRLVGYVAAKEESASVDFADRLGDEEPVPEEDWTETRSLVRVRGDSMRECEVSSRPIVDGSLLIIEPVQVGQYQKGDVVIAKTPDGQVCKKYGGQGSAARPKRSAGVVVLESCSPDGKTIEAPLDSDEQPGIRVQAKVIKVVDG